MTQEANGERFERGMKVLQRIGGEGFDLPIKRLAEASPDLARFTVEYPYGEILSRPGLDLPQRQICTGYRSGDRRALLWRRFLKTGH